MERGDEESGEKQRKSRPRAGTARGGRIIDVCEQEADA
jgi:hypothetical protein